jgi:acetolactate synthase-1/2/3 large subunit
LNTSRRVQVPRGVAASYAGARFGIYPSRLDRVRLSIARGRLALDAIPEALIESDPFVMTLVRQAGTETFGAWLAAECGCEQEQLSAAVADWLQRADTVGRCLTGAETVALVMARRRVALATAYPGTSELALCDAIARGGRTRILNGRGDAESVFVAAGANIYHSGHAIAIVHGARGLTNAAGALADVRRNEIGLLCLVGMASTRSRRYLPPHSEPELIAAMRPFVKDGIDMEERFSGAALPWAPGVARSTAAAENFVRIVEEASVLSAEAPSGPVILGLPQDALENAWIPLNASLYGGPSLACAALLSPDVGDAARMIAASTRPLVLVDDLAFRMRETKRLVFCLAERLHAPVIQVPHRRGPMLFEQAHAADSQLYVGPYRADDSEHGRLLAQADILLTIEDRNASPRVIGRLPSCRKVAITSNPMMTRKNGYLCDSDVVLANDAAKTLEALLANLRQDNAVLRPVTCPPARELPRHAGFLRRELAATLGAVMGADPAPVLVDDSQMFGGLLAESYGSLPHGIRVFGDLGGFVGAGLGYAVGVALSDRGRVWCTVGDQGFLNGFQALASAAEQETSLSVVLCNNGGSVSLAKQINSQLPGAFDDGHEGFLANHPAIDCVALAAALGIRSARVDLRDDGDVDSCRERVFAAAANLAVDPGPSLLELLVSDHVDAWRGIWATRGLDEMPLQGVAADGSGQ